jgi:ABC-type transport system substrate-binding protein
MQRIYATQLYNVPLYFQQQPDILPKWLGGYEATGKESFMAYFAEAWRHD